MSNNFKSVTPTKKVLAGSTLAALGLCTYFAMQGNEPAIKETTEMHPIYDDWQVVGYEGSWTAVCYGLMRYGAGDSWHYVDTWG